MTVPVRASTRGEIMESVIVKGDLSKLSPEERSTYYMRVCESVGMNPLTRPLEYITLNGKLTLYAKRDAADQLRKINGISVQIVSQEESGGLLIVHVRANDNNGRTDEDLGAVAFPETLKGEARANAILKAVTKAKRRVTLSISGLGFLDETEVEDIPASAKRPARPAPNLILPAHDENTGEIIDESPRRPAVDQPASPDKGSTAPSQDEAGEVSNTDRIEALDKTLADAAALGMDALKAAWANVPAEDKPTLKSALDRRHKPAAEAQ